MREFPAAADQPAGDVGALRQRLRRCGVEQPFGRPGLRQVEVAVRAAQTALRAARQECHLSLHGRRRVAGGLVRPQAAARSRTRQAVRREDQPDAVRQHRHDVQVAVGVQAIRPVRPHGQRYFSAHRRDGGRVVRCALDDVGVFRAQQREFFSAHRHRRAGAAEHGRVDELRPRHTGDGSAGLRGAQRRPRAVRRLG